MVDRVPIQRALISVTDKTGLERLGRRLDECGIDIVSTGGTANALKKQGIPVCDISQFTDLPEMMDGRLKTLHHKVHGGLLAIRDNEEHLAAMEKHAIGPIDLLVVNLYQFGTPAEMARLPCDEAVEKIDIGGPAMIRSAAKNHKFVTVVTDWREYDRLCDMVKQNGGTTLVYRQQRMIDAFAHTAAFDARVAKSFQMRFPPPNIQATAASTT